jgi:hypothetical protein
VSFSNADNLDMPWDDGADCMEDLVTTTERPRIQLPKSPRDSLMERIAIETDLDPITLLAQLREQTKKIHALEKEAARYEARYGSAGNQGSHYDRDRKALLAELKEDARALYAKNPETTTDSKGNEKIIPLTDGRADDMARMHPRYRRFLAEAESDLQVYADLKADIGEALGVRTWIKESLEMIRAATYYAGQEARLTPSNG